MAWVPASHAADNAPGVMKLVLIDGPAAFGKPRIARELGPTPAAVLGPSAAAHDIFETSGFPASGVGGSFAA